MKLRGRILGHVLGLMALLTWGVSNVSAQNHEVKTQQSETNSALELVKTVFNDATSVTAGNTLWHVIKNAKGTTLGYALSSRPFTKDIIGYRGPTPLVLILDNKKHIKKLCLLENNESPGFISKLSSHGFLDSWNGKSLKEAASSEVDAVSGATLSSTAIKKNVSILASQALKTK
ncbi:MAG: FMN-binding protein [Bacteroidota bacterium]|nr:FMN-binding protein [Bacteroidota bacterium]